MPAREIRSADSTGDSARRRPARSATSRVSTPKAKAGMQLLEQAERDLVREYLEATLRVAEAGQAEEPEHEVERLGRELPQPGLSHRNDAVGHGARRAHHLSGSALDCREALRDLGGARREVGVG